MPDASSDVSWQCAALQCCHGMAGISIKTVSVVGLLLSTVICTILPAIDEGYPFDGTEFSFGRNTVLLKVYLLESN